MDTWKGLTLLVIRKREIKSKMGDHYSYILLSKDSNHCWYEWGERGLLHVVPGNGNQWIYLRSLLKFLLQFFQPYLMISCIHEEDGKQEYYFLTPQKYSCMRKHTHWLIASHKLDILYVINSKTTQCCLQILNRKIKEWNVYVIHMTFLVWTLLLYYCK